MIYQHGEWFFPILVCLIICFVSYFLYLKKYHLWLQKHWMVRPSLRLTFSNIFLALGFIFFAVILLDPRGEGKDLKVPTPKHRTILLLDTSASMMAEDVRPNRLEKTIILAKHFVRQARNHEISLLIFADITKKLSPFTSDLELLDARLDSLKEMRNLYAGSSITSSISEAITYFESTQDDELGSLVVITDGEENAEVSKMKIPEKVKIVLLGVGTAQGSTIPLKDKMGIFYGYKKEKGVNIITKRDESFFKKFESIHKNTKSILVGSFDLPTEEILAFIQTQGAEGEMKNQKYRPVAIKEFALWGLAFYALSFLLRLGHPYIFTSILWMLFLTPLLSYSNEEQKLSEKAQLGLERLKKGELSSKEQIYLADLLTAEKNFELAHKIYKDHQDILDKNEFRKSHLNYGTALVGSQKIKEGLEEYAKLKDRLDGSSEDKLLKETIDKNIQYLLQEQARQKSQSKENKKDQSDQNTGQQKNDNQQQDQKNQQSNQKQNQGHSKNQQQSNSSQKESSTNQEDKAQPQESSSDKDPFSLKNQKETSESKDEKKAKDKEQGDGKKNESNEKEGEKKSATSSDEQKIEDKSEPKGAKKLSPLLQQLKQDDRKLQSKLLDTTTQKRNTKKKRDW